MINIRDFRLEFSIAPGLEILHAFFLLGIVFYLYRVKKNQHPFVYPDWRFILGGFGLLLSGTILDIAHEIVFLSSFGLTFMGEGIVFSGGYLLLLIGFIRDVQPFPDKTEELPGSGQASRQIIGNLEPRIAGHTAEPTNAALRKEISEYQQAESALRERHALLNSIIEGTTDAIFLIDVQGRYRIVNTATAQLLGKPVEALEGKHLKEVLSPEVAGLFLEQNHQIMADDQSRTIEYTITIKDATCSFSIMKAPYRDRQGQITGVIGVARDITERKSYEAQLEYQVNYDSLTQLPNRILLQNRLRRAIARAKRYNQQIAVLFLDLDGFKMINDKLGHAAGDELLKAVASRLTKCVREEDTVARLSGDEFVMVLENLAQEECATVLAHKVLQAMDAPFTLKKQTCSVATSIGISLYPRDGQDKETLLKNADTALYQAKGRGGKGIQCYTPQMDLPAPKHSTGQKDSLQDTWRGTLLVVDDDQGMTACIKRLLRGEDYLILTAHSGWEGLALLACHRIEVVVSDQLMPEMSGTTFLKQVRELYPDTTRILLSGSDDREFLIEAINEGAIYKFMDKSLDSAHWQAVIREAFLFHKQQNLRLKANSA